MDPALVPALYDALTVARLGSVAAAAKRLGKTPSAVSQQIRHLTEALGVPLFERRGRGLALTPAAQQVLPAATRLFDEAETVFRLFGELEGTATTTLRLAASDYLARPLLVPVLRDLAAEGVPLHFEISTAHSEEALARLEHGDVELAIVAFSGARPGLEARVLFEQPFFWVGPARSGSASGLVERLLGGEPLLRLAPGSTGRRLLDRFIEQRGLRPRSTIDVPSVSLLLAYAVGGVGIGLVPGLALGDGTPRSVTVERAGLPDLPVRLALRARRRPAPAVEQFIERLEREAAALKPRLASLPGAGSARSSARQKPRRRR
jgi:DNA-binding transcriptional LysR family regulator